MVKPIITHLKFPLISFRSFHIFYRKHARIKRERVNGSRNAQKFFQSSVQYKVLILSDSSNFGALLFSRCHLTKTLLPYPNATFNSQSRQAILRGLQCNSINETIPRDSFKITKRKTNRYLLVHFLREAKLGD